MKEEFYTSLICERFCIYYKSGKETEFCNGYFYLQKFVTPSELNSIIKMFHLDKEILAKQELPFLCNRCDFKEGGCDFFVNKSKIPCGGYLIISRLLNCLNIEI